jgi:hypothetical protein
MVFTEAHRVVIDRLDLLLRHNAQFRAIPLAMHGYKAWYALLLGSFAVTVGNEEVVFAHAAHDQEIDSAELLVFTTSTVAFIEVTAASEENAKVTSRTISRGSIRSLDVQVSDRHDVEHWGRTAKTWPGASRSDSSTRRSTRRWSFTSFLTTRIITTLRRTRFVCLTA